MRFRTLARIAAAGLLAMALSGCISLLPKSKPVQLYRFGLSSPHAPATPPAGKPAPSPKVGVFWASGTFEQEAAGDGILTVTGPRVAYIAGSRWAAPADTLFDQAVFAAFDRDEGHVRLVPRGAPSPTDFVLRADVRTFETRYDQGDRAAPAVVITVHATMTRDRQRTLVSDQDFTATVRAGSNRVSAIVAAYDQALAQVLGQLVTWVNQQTA